jgi:DNA-binding winged helix-turn-helix (wHTH) protein/tetratricopeptide (TPR) repeat protein
MRASCFWVGSNVFKQALNNFHVFSIAAMTPETKHLYEFGPYRIDPAKRVLLRAGEWVPLPSKVFEALLVLVRHSQEVVSKDELMKTVWPDSFVEESNLSQSIFLLRKALGETAQDHRYIVTIPGQGYRFAETVREISAGDGDLVVECHSMQRMTVEDTESPPCGPPASLRPKVGQRPWSWVLSLTAMVALVASASVLVSRMRRPPPLKETDLVLVSDFVNTTGEAIFDGSLKQALTVKLAESPYFNLVSDTRTRQTLSMMSRSPDERVVSPIAREVCQREGAKVVVGGSILSLGSKYALDVDVTNCLTGDNLAHQEVEALNKEQVLSKLGQLIPPLRRQLGESLGSIQKFDTPIEQATTKSLTALKAYTSGDEKRAQGQEVESIPFYETAIELDPDFAIAYARLAAVHTNLQQPDLGNKYLQQAFERRGRVSEREKFYIQAHYYLDVTKEIDKEIETYKRWAELYPRDLIPFNNLSNEYVRIGQPDKAIEAGQQALRLNPEHTSPYTVLARAYLRATRFPEAKAVCEKAIAQKLDGWGTHQTRYFIAVVEDDRAVIQREIDWFKGKPLESWNTYDQAMAAMSRGQLRGSRELFAHAGTLALKQGLKELAASMTLDHAFYEADLGDRQKARAAAAMGLRMISDSQAKAFSALAFARVGDIGRAQALTNEMAKQPYLGTTLNEVLLPCVRAAIELDRRNPGAAIEQLRRALPYDLATPPDAVALYYRGLAYMELQSGKEAATQFQKIVDNRGVVPASIYWPLAHLELARAYAVTGESDKSLAEYREFLALWRNADPDLPLLKKAKAEYATLSKRGVGHAGPN